MSDATKPATLFDALHELSEIVPQMRAGQLIAAVGELCMDRYGRGLWEVEDAELSEALAQFRRGVEDAGLTKNAGR